MNDNEKNIEDYFAIVKRRKWQIVIPIVFLTIISIVVAKILPSIYSSTATILIEGQEIPQELVRSTVTSYADQRIQVISQHVMTRSSLNDIISKFDLYQYERDTKTRDELVKKLREKISLEMISANVVDPRSGTTKQATIAFTLAFESKIPETAQRVLNEIVTLYLNENLKTRRRQAAEATQFFTDEAARLSQDISELENELAIFKQDNVGRLPEQAQLNIQILDRAERDSQNTYLHIQSLQERITFLTSELRQTNPYISVNSPGQPVMSLQEMEAEFSRMTLVYSANHPDRIRLQKKINALKGRSSSSVKISSDASSLKSKLQTQKDAYHEIVRKYNTNHPDALKLNRSIVVLENSIAEFAASSGSPTSTKTNDSANNPTYISLRAQLEAAGQELRSTNQRYASLQSKLEDYENRLLSTPQIERKYRSLTRNYESALTMFKNIKAKQLEANVAQQLERDAKAERFTLLEPPLLPTKPISPNRLAIIFLGIMLSVACGIGLALVLETMDKSIHGVQGLLTVVNKAPLAIIPYIENSAEQHRDAMKLKLLGIGATTSVVIFLVMLHFMWMPMDVAWLVLQRKLFG